MPWITPQDVADHLGTDVDDRLDMATEAVRVEVERVRADVDFEGNVPGNIVYGAVLWAALYYQQRTAPTGFAGYGDGADLLGDVLGSRKGDIYRLIGLRRPLTA